MTDPLDHLQGWHPVRGAMHLTTAECTPPDVDPDGDYTWTCPMCSTEWSHPRRRMRRVAEKRGFLRLRRRNAYYTVGGVWKVREDFRPALDALGNETYEPDPETREGSSEDA